MKKTLLLLILLTASTACASSNQWSTNPVFRPFELKATCGKNKFSKWMLILEQETGIPVHLDRTKLSESGIDVDEVVWEAGMGQKRSPWDFIVDKVDQLVDSEDVMVVRINNDDSVTITTK